MKKPKDINDSLKKKYVNYAYDLQQISIHMNELNKLLPKVMDAVTEILKDTEAVFELNKTLMEVSDVTKKD